MRTTQACMHAHHAHHAGMHAHHAHHACTPCTPCAHACTPRTVRAHAACPVDTQDLSIVKSYVLQQCDKVRSGRLGLQDFLIASEVSLLRVSN